MNTDKNEDAPRPVDIRYVNKLVEVVPSRCKRGFRVSIWIRMPFDGMWDSHTHTLVVADRARADRLAKKVRRSTSLDARYWTGFRNNAELTDTVV